MWSVLSVLVSILAPVPHVPFAWGVNGHPVTQEGYRQIPAEEQFSLLAAAGCRWYRCDWPEEVFRRSPKLLDDLVRGAARRGIRILPVLFPSPGARSDASPGSIREGARRYGRDVAARFRGRITHYELDNELDVVAMIRRGERDRNGREWQWGDPDGDRPEHYEETRYRRALEELRGLQAGVHEGDPKALTIVDTAGWLHTGFLDRLTGEDQLPCDIVGWHWYSEMGDPQRVRGSYDLLAKFRSYGRPIWFTEANRRGGSMGNAGEEQAAYVHRLASQLRASPGVAGFFVYELLDEPYFGPDNPESHYGVARIEKGPDGRWRIAGRKPALAALRAAILGKPMPGNVFPSRSGATRREGAR